MKRILIVDDFAPGRIVLREKLKIQGHTCQEVCNGSEALRAIRLKAFDLVITDNKMPVMTGLEFIQTLVKQLPTQHPPVILLTGNPSRTLFEEAQQAGARGIFKKPYDEQELFSEINYILESG